MSDGRIVSVNVSPGGVPKLPVSRTWISKNGVGEDDHDDKEGHGGPERAVCIYSAELIAGLRAEGHPIDVGTAGENLTVAGIDWATMQPGTVWRAGSAVLEITSFTSPCKTIRASFLDQRYKRISQKVHPGWSRVYARVLEEGEVAVGDAFRASGGTPPRSTEQATP